MYTYAPGFITAGSYIPPVIALGPLHVPPASGVPFSAVNRSVAAPWSQTVRVLLPPASGAVVIATTTSACAPTQGAVAFTV